VAEHRHVQKKKKSEMEGAPPSELRNRKGGDQPSTTKPENETKPETQQPEQEQEQDNQVSFFFFFFY
jgi:hypothetical protein